MPPVVIAAAVTAGGAIISSSMASKGQKQAAQAQAQASNDANKVQLDIFNKQQAAAEPWRQMAGQALNRLGMVYGFKPTFGTSATTTPPAANTNRPAGTLPANPQARNALAIGGLFLSPEQRQRLLQAIGSQGGAGSNPAAGSPATGQPATGSPAPAPVSNAQSFLEMDPGYQFRMQEGAKGVNALYAGRGLLESGAAAKAMQRYSQDYASGEFSNAYNRLAALAGTGQTVNQSNNALAQNYANNVSGNIVNAGNARASSYANQGAIWGNAVGSIAGAAGNVFAGGWGQQPPFGSYPSTFAGR